MNSPESSVPVTDNMRSAASRIGGRALSNAIRPSIMPSQSSTWHPNNGIVFRTLTTTSRTASIATAEYQSASQPIWHPSNGIVFRSISSTSRTSSIVATAELRQDHLLHSNAEDNYVMASAGLASLASEPPLEEEAALDEEYKKTGRPTPSELDKCVLLDPEQDELPETSTSYKISEELFRAAKNAQPGSVGSYWSHQLYRSPPDAEGKTKKPTVHYCRTLSTTEKVIKDYFADKKVIGFDIEWAPEAFKLSKARKNVSLVQIACEDRIGLFHLALYPRDAKKSDNSLSGLVAPSLKRIMEDPEVTKVGVAIKADCTRLRNYLDINAQGMFELSHLHKLVKFSKSKDFGLINRSLVSLARQVQEHLHLPLFKGDEVRQTDWSQSLDRDQTMYAASDSYAGLQLYHTLELKRKALDPVPPRPYFAESNKPIRFAEGIEIPSEEDDPRVRPVDAKVVQRTRKFSKKTATETATEISKDEEFTPAAELSHSFFLSNSTDPLLNTFQKTTALQKAEASINRFLKSRQKMGDVSHLPLAPVHLTRRSLKTYYLWLENPKLGLDGIGAMLRSPPTSARSVAKMILEAIRAEGMPYEKRRLREVLKLYAAHMGGIYVPQSPYFELAKDSGYNELMEKAEEKE